ncbi:hypothetical protein FOZ60_004096 [Perkinsus olseni]|uniref:Uncharacterized protein n=1 Tax=Perkinsus olseni TaxID=32597 RepID=A0A7J6PHK2_PEROL|nr:hypothetical protein FOZ60_004096 [Perkinsus olseni]
MGVVHSRLLLRSAATFCLVQAATVDPGDRGPKRTYSYWALITPGVYSSGDLSNMIQGLSSLSLKCIRQGGHKYFESETHFYISKGSEYYRQLYKRRCFIIPSREEGTRQAFRNLTQNVAYFKASPRSGDYKIAICPGSNNYSWNVLLDHHNQKREEIRVDRVDGPVEEADEGAAKSSTISLGHYIALGRLPEGVSKFTMDLVSNPLSNEVPFMIITLFDEATNKVESGSIELRRMGKMQSHASKERFINGCLDTVVRGRQGLAAPSHTADILIRKLDSLVRFGPVSWNSICLCPSNNEGEVLLILNKKEWGTERMKSVQLVKRQPSPEYPGDHRANTDNGSHLTSATKRKKSAPTVMVTETKKARVAPESRVDGNYSVDGPDGERSISLNVGQAEEGIINVQLSFQGKDTYQLRAAPSEYAGKNCWRVDTELGSEGSPIMLYTKLVETLTSLGENVDHFHPERGMHFCFDHENGVAVYFGAENPNDREALKVNFKRTGESDSPLYTFLRFPDQPRSYNLPK